MNGLNLAMAVPSDLLARLLWAGVIILVGLALYRLVNAALLARARKNGALDSLQLPFELRGGPAILYFTTPECAPCKTVQRPALKRLQDQVGERLQVVEVNAAERPDLASRWGVLSVPTTFIIDPRGQLRHINHGVTRAEKLLEQVRDIL